MDRKQRRLFDKVADLEAEELPGSAVTPDAFRIEVEAGIEKAAASPWKRVVTVYSFKGLPPAIGYLRVKALDRSEVKQVAVKQPGAAVPPPLPAEPTSLVVAAALSKWSYIALRPETGISETRALVETQVGDEKKRRLLSVGKVLDGATVTAIEPEGLALSFGGATLTLPASRAVSLQPYDLASIAHGEGWVDYLGKLMDY